MTDGKVTESTATEVPGRCKHDVQMVNEVSERLSKMRGVADLMMCATDDLMADTVVNVGWLIFDLIDEVKNIVCEHEDQQAAA